MNKRVANKPNGGGARSRRTWREHTIKALKRKNAVLQDAIAAEMLRRQREEQRERSVVKPQTLMQRVKNFFRRRAA